MLKLPNSLRTPRDVGGADHDQPIKRHGALITGFKVVLYLLGYILSLWLTYKWVMDRIGGTSAYGFEFFVIIACMIVALMVYPACTSALFITTRTLLKQRASLWSYGVGILLTALVTPYACFGVMWIIALFRAT